MRLVTYTLRGTTRLGAMLGDRDVVDLARADARLPADMLGLLADYEAGRIAPVVGKRFALTEAAAAHRYIQERQNVGKVVLTC